MSKRWTIHDRNHHAIYLTEERWAHIIESHPEIADFEAELRLTLQRGRRRQEPLNPRKYRYEEEFENLPDDFNAMVAIALFDIDVDAEGRTIANNWVATAFLKHIRRQGESE